jgi:hypothetical protein
MRLPIIEPSHLFSQGSVKKDPPDTYTLSRGTGTTTQTVYKYDAVWGNPVGTGDNLYYGVIPDVQSVWNAYDDGEAAPIIFLL